MAGKETVNGRERRTAGLVSVSKVDADLIGNDNVVMRSKKTIGKQSSQLQLNPNKEQKSSSKRHKSDEREK